MKDHVVMATERELIEEIQDATGLIKRNLRAIQKLNQEAGDLGAANAAMLARGKLIVWHGETTKDLNEYLPDHASAIQLRGGGGRGG